MASLLMTANSDTWLKRDWSKQASQLRDTDRAFVPMGSIYSFTSLDEQSLETQGSEQAGHVVVNIPDTGKAWYAYSAHWDFPWDEEPPKQKKSKLLSWDQVSWDNFKCPISEYFTVGEVALYQQERIPTTPDVKKNAIKIARELDKVREWWGSPLLINSWHRPMAVERRIGGSGANHPFGHAVDFRPQKGSIWDLQQRFKAEWYDKGLWSGGMGLGANKGFIHLDLNPKRIWNY